MGTYFWLSVCVLHTCVSKNIENNVLNISTVRLIFRGTKPQPRHNKRHKPIRFVERSRHLVTVHDKLNDPDFFLPKFFGLSFDVNQIQKYVSFHFLVLCDRLKKIQTTFWGLKMVTITSFSPNNGLRILQTMYCFIVKINF